MECSVEASQIAGVSKPKPPLGPKPRLAPKPFSLQSSTTIRSISAPKAVATTSRRAAEPSEKATAVPGPTVPTPALQPTTSGPKPSSEKLPTKATTEAKASPHGDDATDSKAGKSDPDPKIAVTAEKPKSAPLQKSDAIQTNDKASADSVTKPEVNDEKKKDEKTPSVTQKAEEPGSDVSSSTNSTYKRGSTRNRLSMELTSKFEGGGVPLHPQPVNKITTTSSKNEKNKPEPLQPEQSHTAPEPSAQKDSDDNGGLSEDYIGGGSIKRRISLLFDASSRPEVTVRREEPEVLNSSGGVKERIKNWAAEKSPEPERKPQVVARARPKSSEPATPPVAEKAPKVPPAEPPAAETKSSQAVDPPSKLSPAEQSAAILKESSEDARKDESPESLGENKLTEGAVQLRRPRPPAGHTATDEEDSATSQSAQKGLARDNVKRRSVRFGVVERDDGAPPLILGSPSDSSEEGEEEEEDDEEEEGGDDKEQASEDEEEVHVQVPVYRRVGLFRNDEGMQEEEEQQKHLEFEKKRREEENEEARLKLEEKRKRKEEEEEREKEAARQVEAEERERKRLREVEEASLRLEEERRRKEKEEMEKERARQMDAEERERKRLKEMEEMRVRSEEERRRREEEERERERARQMEAEEREKRRQKEMEEMRVKLEEDRRRKEEEEREKERARQMEAEERERTRLKEMEEMRLRFEEERRRKEEEDRERERARQIEAEESERRRLREMEMERLRREEWERVRLEEVRMEQERIRAEELERERLIELMLLRQRQEERGERHNGERLDQQAKEKERLEEEERLRRDRERQEEEERSIHEIYQHKLENKLRAREMNKEKKREEEWEKEWLIKTGSLTREEEEERKREKESEKEERVPGGEERLRQENEKNRLREEVEERYRSSEEEREKREEMERRDEERMREMEKERVEEFERKMQEELERRRLQELQEELRTDNERGKGSAEPNLISFDSEDVPLKAWSPHSPAAENKPPEPQIEVVYEDFSVKKPLIEVEYDDFSVKPKRWGTKARAEPTPVIQSWEPDPVDTEEVAVSALEDKEPEQVENTDGEEPGGAPEIKEEEEQLISFSMEVEKDESEVEEEEEGEEKEETKEDEVKEDDENEPQSNTQCPTDEDQDTDALIDTEPDQQIEAHEQTTETDSLEPVSHLDAEDPSQDVDTTDFHTVPDVTPFPETFTPLLDTSAQKSKRELGKRRSRSRPSRLLRAGLPDGKSPDWRTRDSTDEIHASSKERESDSEDEQPKPKIVCSPPPASPRVPVFPGLSPAALIAQIKRKTGGGGPGGGEETEEDVRREERGGYSEEAAAPSPSQLSSSPRTAAHLAGAARVLPPIGGTDGGAASCPAWLKELKSKKRLSQYGSET